MRPLQCRQKGFSLILLSQKISRNMVKDFKASILDIFGTYILGRVWNIFDCLYYGKLKKIPKNVRWRCAATRKEISIRWNLDMEKRAIFLQLIRQLSQNTLWDVAVLTNRRWARFGVTCDVGRGSAARGDAGRHKADVTGPETFKK